MRWTNNRAGEKINRGQVKNQNKKSQAFKNTIPSFFF